MPYHLVRQAPPLRHTFPTAKAAFKELFRMEMADGWQVGDPPVYDLDSQQSRSGLYVIDDLGGRVRHGGQPY